LLALLASTLLSSASAKPFGKRVRNASLSIAAAVANGSPVARHERRYVGPVYAVPLRFHLLQSAESNLMHSRADDALLHRWVHAANGVYQPAGIRFVIESVLREPVHNVAGYDELAQNEQRRIMARRQAKRRGESTPGSPTGKYRWANVLPLNQRIERGIDVFVAWRVVGAGGYYLCDHRAIVISESRMRRIHVAKHALTLSHELGHALGLPHTSCSEEGNVMKKPCSRHYRGKPPITDEQLIIARAAAASGEPQACVQRDDAGED
jgi:hypothetical protein